MTATLSAARVRELLHYNPKTGRFIWRRRPLRAGLERIDKGWNKRFAGRLVAERAHRNGHLQLNIFCKNYMAHRVAWMHVHGIEPDQHIDHINGNPSDNRIVNLRLATQSQNMANSRRRSDNSSGVKGISWSRSSQKWYAYITKNQKMIALGLFKSLDDACQARWAAERCAFGEFVRVV